MASKPQSKEDILAEIKELNAKISRKQRAELYETLQDIITKPIFNQIMRGAYVSANNIPLSKALLEKLREIAHENQVAMNSL